MATSRLLEARTSETENQRRVRGARGRLRGVKLLEALHRSTLKPTYATSSRSRRKDSLWEPTSGGPFEGHWCDVCRVGGMPCVCWAPLAVNLLLLTLYSSHQVLFDNKDENYNYLPRIFQQTAPEATMTRHPMITSGTPSAAHDATSQTLEIVTAQSGRNARRKYIRKTKHYGQWIIEALSLALVLFNTFNYI